MKQPRILELFSGAGGLALGFENAGFAPLGLIEKDKDCIDTLRKNRPDWPIIHNTVDAVNYDQFNMVDVISGGFPCQAFSTAGKRLGFKDNRGSLFFDMMAPILDLRPRVVLAENVAGLLHHDNGNTIRILINTLNQAGYTVTHQVLNAVDFGVPQKRKRLILMASRDAMIPEIKPEPQSVCTLKMALQNCPKSDGILYSDTKKKVLSLVPPGGCWTSLPDEIQQDYMGASYGRSSKMGGRRGMARRLSWDEPSLTILCSPSQKQTDRCHPDETRPLTIRESARIQTFPDEWDFCGSVSAQYRQIGNAVPVMFATAIANHIRSYLN